MRQIRRIVAGLLCAGMMVAVCGGCDTKKPNDSSNPSSTDGPHTPHVFDTVGYYAYQGVTQEWIDFWLDCGIDTIELLDIGWYYNPNSRLAMYQEQMKEEIELAQKNGIKVYVLLLTNLEQWKGPGAFGNGSGKVFDPADEAMMAERLSYIESNIQYWNMADGFGLFAGDPGGVLGLSAEGGLSYYVDMSKKVHEMVKKHAPQAQYNMNIWAVSQYVQEVCNPWDVNFWLSEGSLGREIIAMDDLLGPDVGIEIPGHDYYRALALRLYYEKNKKPEHYFPARSDVEAMNAKNTVRTWGFCHFLMDELDDGDSAGDSRTTLPNLNTRYIYKYVQSMRDVGMSGVIAGNATLNNYANLYAFSRFAKDPTATPEKVLREYAGMIATDESADALFEILKYIENDANWHQKLPKEEQVALFETSIKSPEEAYALMKTIKVRDENNLSDFSLPELPMASFTKLNQRVKMMLPEGALPGSVGYDNDGNYWISGFEEGEGGTIPASDPAKTDFSGKLASTGEYALTHLTNDTGKTFDLSLLQKGGTLHLSVYADQESDSEGGYILFSDSMETLGAPAPTGNGYEFRFKEPLKQGWNELSFTMEDGAVWVKELTNWSKVGAIRLLFFGGAEATFYVDDFYISPAQS